MYTTNEEQIASVESFIGKIPGSIVKGDYERWLIEVKKDGRISSEEMEKFVSLANALPKDLQNFPQTFSHSVKNYANTAKQEFKEAIVQKAELTSLTDKSISGVADVDKKQPEAEVREGAKLHSDKDEAKPPVKPVVFVKGGGKK